MLLFAVACAGCGDRAWALGAYEIIDLGDLGGMFSRARAINGEGLVVGESLLPLSGVVQRGFLWQDGVMSDLATLGGGSSQAADINRSGTICGWAQDAAGLVRPTLWQGMAPTELPGLGGTSGAAWGLNDAGTAVGNSQLAGGGYHATVWTGNGVEDLGTLGGSYSVAYDINNQGSTVGTASDSEGRERACLWEAGGAVDLGSLSNGEWIAARAVNDSGQVILWGTPPGEDGNHAAFWSGDLASPVTDLGTFGGTDSWAFGLNNLGFVVGWAAKDTGIYEAFVWDGTVMAGLGTLGGLYSSAYGINDQGIIVGFAHDAAGITHAVEWVPVPEAAPLPLLLGGLVGLWVLRRPPGPATVRQI